MSSAEISCPSTMNLAQKGSKKGSVPFLRSQDLRSIEKKSGAVCPLDRSRLIGDPLIPALEARRPGNLQNSRLRAIQIETLRELVSIVDRLPVVVESDEDHVRCKQQGLR